MNDENQDHTPISTVCWVLLVCFVSISREKEKGATTK
jgi:hypothetical protein